MSLKFKRFGLAIAGIALVSTLGIMPAMALSDVNLNTEYSHGIRLATSSIPEDDQMPENPHAQLPKKVDETIPENATVVSEDLAVTEDGQVQDIKTGQKVNDPKLVGTKDKPADPLAKTNGQQFIPVDAADVKKAVEENNNSAGTDRDTVNSTPDASSQQSQTQEPTVKQSADITPTKVIPAALTNNSYGAYWGSYNGSQAFFESGGKLFAQQAKGIIDVSAWQGNIDWNRARSSGVEGAIVRLGYGWDNDIDAYAKRNINELKRLNMPFGVYSYSYAYDVNTARAEGYDMVRLLREAGIAPGDLSYPVYYDLEKWTWDGHHPPTDSSIYEQMVNAWVSVVQGAGYKNAHVYSYTSYLNSSLNRASIHQRTSWVASYGSRTGFSYSTNARGWQYSSQGRVAGIAGAVDVNAFGVADAARGAEFGQKGGYNVSSLPVANIPNGKYYINAALKFSSSVDMTAGHTGNGTRTQLYGWNNSKAQQFEFIRQSDGSYEIVNVNSGRALDVYNADPYNSAVVQLFDRNNTEAQRWFVRDAGNGYYLQSALGNWVFDIAGASTANGTAIALYTPNGTNAQRFMLASVDSGISTGVNTWIASRNDLNMVFDIDGGSYSNNAHVQLYRWNATEAQVYRFQQVGNGVYTITNAKSGKLVEISGGAMGNGGTLGQYQDNGTAAQRWMVRKVGNGISFFNANSYRVIDIPSAGMYSGNKLQSYAANGTGAQQWVIGQWKTERDKLNELAAAHRNDLADGVYEVRGAVGNNMVLDVSGGSHANNANVQVWNANGTAAQRWRVTHNAQGYVVLTNVGSGKALDVLNVNKQNGTNVQQYVRNGSYAQQWIAIKQSNGRFDLRSAVGQTISLDVSNAGLRAGTNVQIWHSANDTPAQRWIFVRE